MPAFRHVLLPVDFSERCDSIRPLVQALVERFNAKLTLLHVVQVPSGWYGGVDGGYPILFDVPQMERAAQAELNSGYKDFPAADKVVSVGDPAAEITQFASANDVDLIMMATHGYGKFRNLLLGSVASKVLHDATCAVWTAAHTENPDLRKHMECKSIMAAVDVAPECVDLIRQYAKLAKSFEAKLRLAHALPDGSADQRYGLDPQFRMFIAKSSREQLAAMQVQAGTDFEVCMAEGSVSKVVRDAALHHEADLVLLGRNTLRAPFGQLRTNAYSIIRDSPCPVLSV